MTSLVIISNYNKDKKLFYKVYSIYIDKVCEIFKKMGININTVPVLDVIRKNTHNVIGNRSFSQNSENVTKLGNVCINLYKKNNIATVIKHIPGHGLSKCDTHYKTPIIKKNKDRYNRSIGTCYIKNQDINQWLVKNGYAIAYKKYSKKYVLDEQYAKENELGIWKGTFTEPEKWRRIMN